MENNNLPKNDAIVQLPLIAQQVASLQFVQHGAQSCSPYVVRNPAPNSSPVVANATFERHRVAA